MSYRYVPKRVIALIMSVMLLFSSIGFLFGTSKQVVAASSTGPSSILEWLPAPGQFTNEAGWGGTGDINAKWTNTPGSTGVSLGAFGGSIVYKFDDPIQNSSLNPYGVDFTVFGNAFSGNEEPAGVAVAQDDGTGNPGTWYYIAGSEHYEDSTIWDYQVTYTNPEPEFTTVNGVNVPWTDNKSGSGNVKVNSYHKHAYYPIPANYPNAPIGFNNLSQTYTGVKINVKKNAFGYPDTHANGNAPYDVPVNPYLTSPTKGDPIDISWAVDSTGKPVSLNSISYVRVFNAVQMDGGALGEIGAEISSLQRVTANSSVSETADLSSIVLSGTGADSSATKQVTVTAGVYEYNDILINADKIKLTANGTASNIFINNKSGTTGTLIDKEITLSETTPKIVRVIAQDGLNTPKIYYLSIRKGLEEVNKSSLNAAITNVDNMQKGDHTDVSWQALQNSLAAAKLISASPTALQEQVDVALSDLLAAVQGLQINAPPGTPQQLTVSVIISGYSATAGKSVTLAKADTQVEEGKTAAFAINKLTSHLNVINASGNYITSIGGLATGDGGPKSGWMYLVNGQFADVGIADYVLKSSDIITLIYTDDYEEDITTIANKTALNARIVEMDAVQQGNYTDVSWQALQVNLTLAKGVVANSYAIQYHADSALSKLNSAYQNLQTKPIPQIISVSFQLNGYSKVAGKNVTLPKTTISVEEGKTAAYVIEKVLNEASIPFENSSGNYISSVGGLAEFDGGVNSGWLYSVDGIDPEVGIADYILTKNASIILRYTENYVNESSGPYVGGNSLGDKKSIIEIPSDSKADHPVNITKDMNDKELITINIPVITSKVILNLTDVKDSIPMISAVKGDISFSIDKGTVLKSGNVNVELLTSLDTKDSTIQDLVKNGLSEEVAKQLKLGQAFAMGNPNESVLFDRPVTLVLKGAKGQQVGFIEGNVFTPIEIYGTEAEGIEATKGKEKITYAFVQDNNLIIKTNHFTSFVSYTTSEVTAVAVDLNKLYSDVTSISTWALDAIREATEKAFVEGSNGKFSPQATVTRAEFMKMLVGVLGLDVKAVKVINFNDVAQGDWFYPYVNAAYKAGLISGTSADEFSPNEKLTREQMAVIMVNALKLQTAEQALAIDDMEQVSEWAKASVLTIMARGLMSGWDNQFHPSDEVTREMAIVVAMRAYHEKK
ncbi:S-layer homology domain-containing protein [Paenibacillus oryzisoli]|uniref:SLH domain-containing protein n=1 Tax=Paenibacillus oryzisoli TaxID=1850517 RepID=A0A198AFQ0_9BACL|nr:S-layer homology domain-containing protein [Paenibacillus oryzisoli]OAS19895.1 hypothetical protein A8708_09095 [Paenibacillus oryzisoli]